MKLLEEGGEEDIVCLVNTRMRRHGDHEEVVAVAEAVSGLIALGFALIGQARSRSTLEWISLSMGESLALSKNLANCVDWSCEEEIWKWSSPMHRAQIVVTEPGAVKAREILEQEGYDEQV